MGRSEKGFDFLGYHFGPQGLSLAEQTIDNFLEKARRIHERGSETSENEELSDYMKRWHRWTRSGLSAVPIDRKRYLEIVGKGPWVVRNHVHQAEKSRWPMTCTVPVGSPAL